MQIVKGMQIYAKRKQCYNKKTKVLHEIIYY